MSRTMLKERHPRGFKIIDRHRKPKKSICLFVRNGDRYVILINYYFLGICMRSKLYEFNKLEQANTIYRRLLSEKSPEKISVPLLRKQSVGF